MVRALKAARALAFFMIAGCYAHPAAHSPDGMILTPVAPAHDDDDVTHLTASTEYAYAPAPKTSPPFDARAAREALVRSDPSACGVSGEGHAKVTFLLDGTVLRVVVDHPPDLPPPVQTCVREAYASARIPEFSGGAVTLGTSFGPSSTTSSGPVFARP